MMSTLDMDFIRYISVAPYSPAWPTQLNVNAYKDAREIQLSSEEPPPDLAACWGTSHTQKS